MATLAKRTGVLGRRLAAHLLRRATYTPTKAQIEAFSLMTAEEAFNALMQVDPPSIPEPIDPLTGVPWIDSGLNPVSTTSALRRYVSIWWLDEARQDNSLLSKMSFFLHTVFVAAIEGLSERVYDHIRLLRFYALGNFKSFALRMTMDNMMLGFLDNTLNNKGNPNENYAREFLELFTIGKGEQVGAGDYTNYTEDDVVQAARVLTGIKTSLRGTVIDPESGVPLGRIAFNQHDTANKSFSHRFDSQTIVGASNSNDVIRELQDFIDMIYAKEETAKNFVRKLYRFFVGRKIDAQIENDVITPLASTFFNGGYEIEPLLRELFTSTHFYDEDDSDSTDEIIGNMIKGPLELFLGGMSFFDVKVPDPAVDANAHYRIFYSFSITNVFFAQAGFLLFAPQVVAGYPAYYQAPSYHRNWFSSSTIIARYKLGEILTSGNRVLAGGRTGDVKIDIAEWTKNNISAPDDANILIKEFLDFLIPETSSRDRFKYYLEDIFLADQTLADWAYEWGNFVLTDDDTEVQIPLNNLVVAIMYSPEYQLF
ncbi:MAG: DUF1800 domain-containing protein [Bacteroidia bacterium]|nr:DUF1800 domain-containing protein [Bacteroidia bacterium]